MADKLYYLYFFYGHVTAFPLNILLLFLSCLLFIVSQ